MIFKGYYQKHPQARLDVTLDWSDELGSDTISASTWNKAGLPNHPDKDDTKTDKTATGWFGAGGSESNVYHVTNTIETAGGRTLIGVVLITIGAHFYDTDIEKVRVLSGDTDYNNQFNSDEEIAAYLEIEDNNHYAAAAHALECAATKVTMKLKVFKTIDLQVDGAKVADSMRKHAATLRGLSDNSDGFEFANVVPKYSIWDLQLP